MKKELTNKEIIKIYNNFKTAFNDKKYFPARVNFFIMKNITLFEELFEEIEEARMEIITHYGRESNTEPGVYNVDKENLGIAQKELDDLLNAKQDIVYQTLTYEDIEKCEFTMPQMKALMFMIKEDEIYDEEFEDE